MKTSKAWFIPKKYGYGYMPCTWQGWLLVAKFVLGILFIAFVDGLLSYSQGVGIVNNTVSTEMMLRFILDIALWAGITFVIILQFSEGELKWRWGGDQ